MNARWTFTVKLVCRTMPLLSRFVLQKNSPIRGGQVLNSHISTQVAKRAKKKLHDIRRRYFSQLTGRNHVTPKRDKNIGSAAKTGKLKPTAVRRKISPREAYTLEHGADRLPERSHRLASLVCKLEV